MPILLPVRSHFRCRHSSTAFQYESPAKYLESSCSVCSTWVHVASRILEAVSSCSHALPRCLLHEFPAAEVSQPLFVQQSNAPLIMRSSLQIPQITTSRHAPMQWLSSVKICGSPYIICATCQTLNETSNNLQMHSGNHSANPPPVQCSSACD